MTTASILSTGGSALQYFTVAILGIGIVYFLYIYFFKQRDNAPDDTRIAVKIDRRGNYRYESVPENREDMTAFWWRVLIIVIALALLFIPLNLFLNRS